MCLRPSFRRGSHSSSTGPMHSSLPRAFYELARATAECSTQEAYLRSAISRMYFANHLLAMIKVPQRFSGFEARSRGDDHGGVIQALRKMGRTRVVGDLLADLRDRRSHADYHIEVVHEECDLCQRGTVDVIKTDWEDCLEVARRCFEKLESL